jgi:hypothetical protein
MPETPTVSEVIKSDENLIRFELLRTPKGLRLTTKVVPRIEEFFKVFTENVTKPLGLYTRKWATPGTDVPASVYTSPNFNQLMHTGSGSQPYTLDALGKPLVITDLPGGKAINLSFLRFVGISDPNGVSVTLDQMISTPELLNMKSSLREAAKQFYIDFMRPVGVTITVMSQETHY